LNQRQHLVALGIGHRRVQIGARLCRVETAVRERREFFATAGQVFVSDWRIRSRRMA